MEDPNSSILIEQEFINSFQLSGIDLNKLPRVDFKCTLKEKDQINDVHCYYGLHETQLVSDKIIWGKDQTGNYFVSFFDESNLKVVVFQDVDLNGPGYKKWVRISAGPQLVNNTSSDIISVFTLNSGLIVPESREFLEIPRDRGMQKGQNESDFEAKIYLHFNKIVTELQTVIQSRNASKLEKGIDKSVKSAPKLNASKKSKARFKDKPNPQEDKPEFVSEKQAKPALLFGQKVEITNPDLEVFIEQCANMGVDFSKITKLSVNLKYGIDVHNNNQVTLQDFVGSKVIWGLDGDKNFFVSYLFQENGKQVVKTIHQDASYEPMQWRRQFAKAEPVCPGWSIKVPDINQVINELSITVPVSSKKLKK